VLALVVLAGVGAGSVFAVSSSGSDDETEQSSFCWGTLSVADVAKMSADPSDSYRSTENSVLESRPTCRVRKAGETSYSFALELRQPASLKEVGIANVDVVAGDSSAVPIGNGIPGWVGQVRAGVWLPDQCAEKLNRGRTQVVLRRLENGGKPSGNEQYAQNARIALTAAAGLAESHGCAPPGYLAGAGEARPEAPHARTPVPGKVCDVSGLDVLPPSRGPADVRYHVSGNDFRQWHCAVTVPVEGGTGTATISRFLVTQDPQSVAAYRSAWELADLRGKGWQAEGRLGREASAVVAECGGRDTLFELATPRKDERGGEEQASYEASRIQLPQPEIFKRFVGSVGKRMGCPDIAPA
jgi:hypothetical protein